MAINVNDNTYSQTPVLKTERFQMHDIKSNKTTAVHVSWCEQYIIAKKILTFIY